MSRFRVIVAGMAVAVVAMVFAAAPASAHDELIASSPRAGESFATAPANVSLQFSDDVLSMGAVVVIADAAGVDWIAAEPVLNGTTVTAEVLPDMPVAGYELRWRVVSSDGHPISGIIPFTVGDAEPLIREATPAAAADEQDAESQITQEDGAVWRVVLIGAGGAILAVAMFALVRFLLRRRDTPDGAGIVDP